MNRKEFEKIVDSALEELPAFFKEKIENLSIVIEDKPSHHHMRKNSRRGEVMLGLYEGVPLDERGQGYAMALPDKITLFKNNIESFCKNDNEIKKEIVHVVQHELAHHFGISDEELKKLGKY